MEARLRRTAMAEQVRARRPGGRVSDRIESEAGRGDGLVPGLDAPRCRARDRGLFGQ